MGDRLAAQHKIISPNDFALLVGLPALRAAKVAPKPDDERAPDAVAAAAFEALEAITSGARS